MTSKMKRSILFTAFILITFNTLKAEPLHISDLSLRPPSECKGSGRPAPRMKETSSTESIGAPASDIDLNGDGWCDWIISLPYPTNTQLPEYKASEAVLLGTPQGARTFGNMGLLKSYWKNKRPVPEGLLIPGGVTGMAPALVAYVGKSTVPYFAGFSSAYPEFWGNAGSYRIYRWNQQFDMPQEVTMHEYTAVMRFWRTKFCRGQYANQDFLRPDIKNEENPLEVFVCAPWVETEIRRIERGESNVP